MEVTIEITIVSENGERLVDRAIISSADRYSDLLPIDSLARLLYVNLRGTALGYPSGIGRSPNVGRGGHA